MPVVVDEVMQEEFFRKVSNQLETITQFFRKEESKLQFSLSELEDQVHYTRASNLRPRAPV